MPIVLTAKSAEATQFTTAIAQNAGEQEDIQLTGGLAGVGGNALNLLLGLAIVSKENLAWEVMLFNKATGPNADPAIDSFIGRWTFTTGDSVQIGGTGLFYFYIFGLEVPYRDEDYTGKLHVVLINRSAAAKTADANGYLTIKFDLQPMSQMTG
jgi:hypothetical protein